MNGVVMTDRERVRRRRRRREREAGERKDGTEWKDA